MWGDVQSQAKAAAAESQAVSMPPVPSEELPVTVPSVASAEASPPVLHEDAVPCVASASSIVEMPSDICNDTSKLHLAAEAANNA